MSTLEKIEDIVRTQADGVMHAIRELASEIDAIKAGAPLPAAASGAIPATSLQAAVEQHTAPLLAQIRGELDAALHAAIAKLESAAPAAAAVAPPAPAAPAAEAPAHAAATPATSPAAAAPAAAPAAAG
jgi:pyruvate dehydrogenase E2 component (dihydrolipoyllysine-residue acetyltransferase)